MSKRPTYTSGEPVDFATVVKLDPGMTGWEHDGILTWMIDDTTAPMVAVEFPGLLYGVPYEPDGVASGGDEPYAVIATQLGFMRRRCAENNRQPKRVRNGSVRKGSTLFTEAR